MQGAQLLVAGIYRLFYARKGALKFDAHPDGGRTQPGHCSACRHDACPHGGHALGGDAAQLFHAAVKALFINFCFEQQAAVCFLRAHAVPSLQSTAKCTAQRLKGAFSEWGISASRL